MSDRPINVLLLGKDGSIFSSGSARTEDTRQRHLYYAQRLIERAPGSEIRAIAYTRGNGATVDRAAPGLTLYPTRSRSRATFLFDLRRRIREVLADGWRPDVITSQEPWEEGLAARSLARRLGARDLPQLHFDILSDDWLSESALNRLKFLLARRVITHASHVRAVSEALKRKLVDRWSLDPARISVAPVGVNFVRSVKTRDECRRAIDPAIGDAPVVLFVGRLVPQKNMPLWLDVARAVLNRVPETRFVIVGSGADRAQLEQRARELGILERVHFLGSRPHAELPDIYAAADVFLLTSDYEGFGRVVLEAMFASRPVVATICSGPEDLVVDGASGYLAERGDAATLASRVSDLLSNRAQAESMGATGARIAHERFGLPALTDRIIDAWQRA